MIWPLCTYGVKQLGLMAVVVAQLAERSVPTPEIRGSIPDFYTDTNVLTYSKLNRNEHFRSSATSRQVASARPSARASLSPTSRPSSTSPAARLRWSWWARRGRPKFWMGLRFKPNQSENDWENENCCCLSFLKIKLGSDFISSPRDHYIIEDYV